MLLPGAAGLFCSLLLLLLPGRIMLLAQCGRRTPPLLVLQTNIQGKGSTARYFFRFSPRVRPSCTAAARQLQQPHCLHPPGCLELHYKKASAPPCQRPRGHHWLPARPPACLPACCTCYQRLASPAVDVPPHAVERACFPTPRRMHAQLIAGRCMHAQLTVGIVCALSSRRCLQTLQFFSGSSVDYKGLTSAIAANVSAQPQRNARAQGHC